MGSCMHVANAKQPFALMGSLPRLRPERLQINAQSNPIRKMVESIYVQAAASTSDTNAESVPTPSRQEMRILLSQACTATGLFL